MAGAEATKKSDLGTRTVSALVMLAVAGAALWLGGWFWIAFVTLVGLGVLWEWRGLVVGFVRSPVARGLWNAAGIIYVVLAAAMLVRLRLDPWLGVEGVGIAIGAVIATDIGAYFAGRTFGGPKIAPAISPSKTWAGLIGGCVAASAWIIAVTFQSDGLVDVWWKVVAGTAVAAIAQTGDFFESWMKRRAGVKDSGNLIPGHGGLLDRVDGLLAVMFIGSLPVLFGILVDSF